MIIQKTQPQTRVSSFPLSASADAAMQTRQSTASFEASVDDLAFGHEPLNIDPHAEDAYWAQQYRKSPYVAAGTTYDEVRAAYRFGWESRRRLDCANWDIALPRLRAEWNADPANFMMTWSEAEPAAHDAWNHAGAQRAH